MAQVIEPLVIDLEENTDIEKYGENSGILEN
jgi:hypothetical protein